MSSNFWLLGRRFLPPALLGIATAISGMVLSGHLLAADPDDREYTRDYRLHECEFIDEGENTYYILRPGYQLVLEGEEDGENILFVHTVLDETRQFYLPEIGWVSARCVEEKEWADNVPLETARGFFAMDKKTADLYDFGDETDIYNDDGTEVVAQEGSWRAGQPDADGLAWPGIFMPGKFLLGARYYQQQADGQSEERAENMQMGLTIKTKAAEFKDCILVHENNLVEPGISKKFHAPGIGLIKEDTLELVAFGYDVFDRDKGTLKTAPKIEIAPVAGSQQAQTGRPVRKVSDEEAVKIALKKVPGQVTHVGLERKLGKLSIVVEVQADTGVETDVIIDMETGEVRGTET